MNSLSKVIVQHLHAQRFELSEVPGDDDVTVNEHGLGQLKLKL